MESRHFYLAVSCTALLFAPAAAHAQIYGGYEADGTAVLSNFASGEAREIVVDRPDAHRRITAARGPKKTAGALVPAAFKGMLEEIAGEYRLDPNLLHAMIRVESGYNTRAVSAKGARGLMQLMPATARRFGAGDLFDPRENLRAGAQYLSRLMDLFGGNVELALAAYNAGEQAVIRAGYRIPSYAETRAYVPKVLSHYRQAAADY